MLISVEELRAEFDKAVEQRKSIDTSIDVMPEPFLRGVHHGYLEGLIHAIRIIIDMEYKERKNG